MKRQHGYTIVEIAIVLVLIVGIWGWGWNIVKLAHDCCQVSGMLVLRAVGIFIAPLGAILGFV